MIKNIAIFSIIYILLASLVTAFCFNRDYSFSVLLGGVMMLLNLAGLSFFWRLIFIKKSIALAVFVIIFKYVILGMILWGLFSVDWLRPIGFLIGVSSLVFAIVIVTLIKSLSIRNI